MPRSMSKRRKWVCRQVAQIRLPIPLIPIAEAMATLIDQEESLVALTVHIKERSYIDPLATGEQQLTRVEFALSPQYQGTAPKTLIEDDNTPEVWIIEPKQALINALASPWAQNQEIGHRIVAPKPAVINTETVILNGIPHPVVSDPAGTQTGQTSDRPLALIDDSISGLVDPELTTAPATWQCLTPALVEPVLWVSTPADQPVEPSPADTGAIADAISEVDAGSAVGVATAIAVTTSSCQRTDQCCPQCAHDSASRAVADNGFYEQPDDVIPAPAVISETDRAETDHLLRYYYPGYRHYPDAQHTGTSTMVAPTAFPSDTVTELAATVPAPIELTPVMATLEAVAEEEEKPPSLDGSVSDVVANQEAEVIAAPDSTQELPPEMATTADHNLNDASGAIDPAEVIQVPPDTEPLPLTRPIEIAIESDPEPANVMAMPLVDLSADMVPRNEPVTVRDDISVDVPLAVMDAPIEAVYPPIAPADSATEVHVPIAGVATDVTAVTEAGEFSRQLYQTWKAIAEQQQPVPWGVPVPIDDIYRHSFGSMMGTQFLHQVGIAIAQVPPQAELVPLLLPGTENVSIQGTEGSFIAFYDRTQAVPPTEQSLSVAAVTTVMNGPATPDVDNGNHGTLTAELIIEHHHSNGNGADAHLEGHSLELIPDPPLMQRLRQERDQHLAEAQAKKPPKQRPWFLRWL